MSISSRMFSISNRPNPHMSFVAATLHLDSNQFSSTLSEEIGKLSKLGTLDEDDIGMNVLIRWNLPSLSSFDYTEDLQLHTNNFFGQVPTSLRTITNLSTYIATLS